MLLAGAAGSALFGVLGLVAALPLLWRLQRRTGGWRWPGVALVAMTAGFLLSTLIVGPAITSGRDGGDASNKSERPDRGPEHGEHHP